MAFKTENEVTVAADGSLEAQARLDGRPVMRLVIPASAAVLNDPDTRPSQTDVDRVAAFVEAAEELDREPFFGPDEKRSWSGGGECFTFNLGDRFHFRSALISFRRIWMEGEGSNFYGVINILWRYATSLEERVNLSWAREFHQKVEREEKHPPLGAQISGRDLVDLWLNTVFAHAGTNPRRKHKRSDFDRIVDQFGQAPFEYAFRMAVFSQGLQYVNVAKHNARPALTRWKQCFGLKPTFRIGSAFGNSTRERTKDGHVIVRKASSEYAANETFDQRLTRILDRPQFRDLKFILNNLDLHEKNLVRLILQHSDFAMFAKAVDYEIHEVPVVSDAPEAYGKRLRASTSVGDWQHRYSKLLLYDDLLIVTDYKGVAALNKQFEHLKQVLIND